MSQDNLQSVAFPTLTEAQLRDVGECASAQRLHFSDGEDLVRPGQAEFPVYFVLSGEIEVVDCSGEKPRTLAVHGPGSFTGDVSNITGAPAVAGLTARGDCEVFAVPRDGLRHVVNQCAGLGDMILEAFIARRQMLRESQEFTGLRVIGSRYSQDTFRIRDFLARNRVLFTWDDVESDPEVGRLLQEFGLAVGDTPVVSFGHRVILRNPSNEQLAERLGIRRAVEQEPYDLVVVGAGPAGLGAAVYGASEGLRTLVVDAVGPGGQAGSSMRIENYLGFPTGLTGAELTDRAVLQASKFGAQLSIPTSAVGLAVEDGYPVVHLGTGESVGARCVLIATGAEYRRLQAEGVERFEGAGLYYAATPLEGRLCEGAVVMVVGGGNSAGQAAVFLARHARRVLMVIRGECLDKSMSAYLVHRIERTRNIEVLTNTTVRRMLGDGHLGCVELVSGETGAQRDVETTAVFSFIGAVPRTDWLPDPVERDDKGFIKTGPDAASSSRWPGRRTPFFLETTTPRVFAAGDVRSGSVKRVAAAVGEGSMAVQFVHASLRIQ